MDRAARAAPAKKRRTWLWVLLTLFGVVVLVVGGGFAFFQITAHNTANSLGAPAGTAVRDGKFEFVVDKVEVADDWSGEPRPRGVFIVADMTVTNIGDEPSSFFFENQKLIDTQGHEYGGDSDAVDALNEDWKFDMDPGSSTNVKVPFDVPPGTTPEKLVLRDSMLSGGVAVKVS